MLHADLSRDGEINPHPAHRWTAHPLLDKPLGLFYFVITQIIHCIDTAKKHS
jgi:hypothetical protein